MLPRWISRPRHNCVKPRTLLLPTWKPVLDFMHSCSHSRAHTHMAILSHSHTCSGPHVAWNSNKALPYCCQGNTVGSDQSSGLSCSRLSTPTPPTHPTSLHSLALSGFLFLCPSSSSSPLSPFLSHHPSPPANCILSHFLFMVTVTFLPQGGKL